MSARVEMCVKPILLYCRNCLDSLRPLIGDSVFGSRQPKNKSTHRNNGVDMLDFISLPAIDIKVYSDTWQEFVFKFTI